MHDATATVQHYLDIWNQPDAAVRGSTIARAWADDARYTDPLMNARGHSAIDAMTAALQMHHPAHHFERCGSLDARGANLRFSWRPHDANGQTVAQGIDVALLDSEQRFSSATGFLDPLPRSAPSASATAPT